MRSSHPQVFLAIAKEQGFDTTKALSILLVIKKLSIHYGKMITKNEMVNAIYNSNKDVGTILVVLNKLGYTSYNLITGLIGKITTLGERLSTIETPNKATLQNIEQTLQETKLQPTVFIEKELKSPGLHIITPSHRYHRDLNGDLDTLLQNP